MRLRSSLIVAALAAQLGLGFTLNAQQGSQVVAMISPNPVYQRAQDAQGFQWLYSVRLQELNGVPTTLTDLTIAGVSVASQIAASSSGIIPANGSLFLPFGYRNLVVPVTQLFVFSGVDADGRQWSQQASVLFLGQAPGPVPAISLGGINPLFSKSPTIQPGSWISIYGTNLAPAKAVWNGDFPTALGGT